MKVLITGAAAFVGLNPALCLLEGGDTAIGVAERNNCYAPAINSASWYLPYFHSESIGKSLDRGSAKPAAVR